MASSATIGAWMHGNSPEAVELQCVAGKARLEWLTGDSMMLRAAEWLV
jgi:hypothetical protein